MKGWRCCWCNSGGRQSTRPPLKWTLSLSKGNFALPFFLVLVCISLSLSLSLSFTSPPKWKWWKEEQIQSLRSRRDELVSSWLFEESLARALLHPNPPFIVSMMGKVPSDATGSFHTEKPTNIPQPSSKKMVFSPIFLFPSWISSFIFIIIIQSRLLSASFSNRKSVGRIKH